VENLSGFRLLLALGAAVSIVAALVALLSPAALNSWLGLKGANPASFVAVARMLGTQSLAVGVAYLLAAIDPARQRSLLVVLLLVPIGQMLAALVTVVGGDMSAVKGSALSVFDLAYVLAYVRLYPRIGSDKERGQLAQ
jgi:hypothetical protein